VHLVGQDIIAIRNPKGFLSQHILTDFVLPSPAQGIFFTGVTGLNQVISQLSSATSRSLLSVNSRKLQDSGILGEVASISTTGNALPAYGPRDASTYITISGNSLNSSSGGAHYCLVQGAYVLTQGVTSTSASCQTPTSSFSGKTKIQLTTDLKDPFSGLAYFEYIEDPLLFDVQPVGVSEGSQLQLRGRGFLRMPSLTCLLDDILSSTVVISDTIIFCTVPSMVAGTYRLTLQTNGQHVLRSGLTFTYFIPTSLISLWPFNGPAMRGNTAVTIYGQNFADVLDLHCTFGTYKVPAIFISKDTIRCRAPSHRAGRVNVTVSLDGTLTHPIDNTLQYVFLPDASVDSIVPTKGAQSGGYPVFIVGNNFVNVSSLLCLFGDRKARGIFISINSIVCLAPSVIGRALLVEKMLPLEISMNGYDYTESQITFSYNKETSEAGGFFDGMSRVSSPNGTFSPPNSNNFTLCDPGFFQPQQGKEICLPCGLGFLCPDFGMSKPIPCYSGQICDTIGLRSPVSTCPAGLYCLENTKAASLSLFSQDKEYFPYNRTAWSPTSNETGFIFFLPKVYSNLFTPEVPPYPADGSYQLQFPPSNVTCTSTNCSASTSDVKAEGPLPCPVGFYCRDGVTTISSIPKNFSTPQKCFDGFFCPLGSKSPEGAGPCPNGYFCPTQLGKC
jgi:hypothetical protein